MSSVIPNEKKNMIPPINKLFSVFLAVYPILCIYRAFSSFTIGDIILIAFLAMSYKSRMKNDVRFKLVIAFSGYAGFSLLFNIMFTSETSSYMASSLFFRYIKYVFYMLCVFLTKSKFNLYYFKKTIYIVSWSASIFLFFQYIAFNVFGRVILGQIKWLPIYLELYTKLDYDRMYSYYFRPCSFFLEPAIFAQYIVVALSSVLFLEKEKDRKYIVSAIVFVVAMLMTTSAQGVLYLVLIFGMYFVVKMKNKAKALLISGTVAIISLISYQFIKPIRLAVDRLSNNNATSARMSSYNYCFSLDVVHMVFGYGYGMTANNEYMPSCAYIWYGCGIIGVIITFAIFAEFYKNSKNLCAKVICLLYLMMFFGASIYYNYMLFWYFAVILSYSYLNESCEDSEIGNSIHSRSI